MPERLALKILSRSKLLIRYTQEMAQSSINSPFVNPSVVMKVYRSWVFVPILYIYYLWYSYRDFRAVDEIKIVWYDIFSLVKICRISHLIGRTISFTSEKLSCVRFDWLMNCWSLTWAPVHGIVIKFVNMAAKRCAVFEKFWRFTVYFSPKNTFKCVK